MSVKITSVSYLDVLLFNRFNLASQKSYELKLNDIFLWKISKNKLI